MPPAVKVLLLANMGSFIVARLWGTVDFTRVFGLTVPAVFLHLRAYQFITYLFVHGDLFHLLFNMLVLYFFGRELEIFWGTSFFLRYYFISGIGAGICSIPFIWGINAPLIGASGALFALLIAYGLLFPDRVVTLLLFFVLPLRMRARQMVAVFIVLELLFLLGGGGGGGIAHFAHLGGALVGFVYLKWPARRKRKERPAAGPVPPKESGGYRDELNRVLDKLAREGWGGLNDREKDFLHDARHNL
ncbi:MAG: rhomboid family intramembrane serine protease [PVC group bacterium]